MAGRPKTPMVLKLWAQSVQGRKHAANLAETNAVIDSEITELDREIDGLLAKVKQLRARRANGAPNRDELKSFAVTMRDAGMVSDDDLAEMGFGPSE